MLATWAEQALPNAIVLFARQHHYKFLNIAYNLWYTGMQEYGIIKTAIVPLMPPQIALGLDGA